MTSKYYYVFTSSVDRAGLLDVLSRSISEMQGEIICFRQDLLKKNRNSRNYGNIHLIIKWNDSDHTPAEIDFEEIIRKDLMEKLYRSTDRTIIDNIIVKDTGRAKIKLVNFDIYFTNNHRFIDNIFRIFSDVNISVVESKYENIPKGDKDLSKQKKDIGILKISANFSNSEHLESTIAQYIYDLEEVLKVDWSVKYDFYPFLFT